MVEILLLLVEKQRTATKTSSYKSSEEGSWIFALYVWETCDTDWGKVLSGLYESEDSSRFDII